MKRRAEEMRKTAAVITISDKASRGERVDTSGPALCALLEADGWEIAARTLVPDDAARIRSELVRCSDESGVDLILTTGGTLIINLPGSERAARENFAAIRSVLDHAVEMLRSRGSADCAG